MRLQIWKNISLSLYVKSSAIFLFFILSVLVVACGSSGTNTTNGIDPSNPAVTVTIRIGDFHGSATPSLPPYSCGAWATDSTPSYYSTSAISVFAKFTQNVNGNPIGVDNANATATIYWPDGTSNAETTTTTSDGLAVFPVAIKAAAVNKIVLIYVTFSKSGVPSCTIPQAAYFTATYGSPTAGSPIAGQPTVTPGGSPTVGPTSLPSAGVTPSPYPFTPIPSPTPKPTKTPKPTPSS